MVIDNEEVGDAEETEEDKTSENNEDPFAEFPNDEEKLSEEEIEEKSKVDKSEVAQKIRYREKLKTAESKISSLEEEITTLKNQGQPTKIEEKELAAQKYILNLARKAIEDYENEKATKEKKVLADFNEELEETLEENKDLTESQILDACEDYEVSPKIAAKILKKSLETKIKKPSLPSPKRGTEEIKPDKKVDDSNKSIWEIASDVKKSLLKK